MGKTSRIVYFILSLVFFVLFDEYFSNQILERIYLIPENSLFDIVFVQNQGAAFNILQGSKIFLIGFSVFALVCIAFYTIKHIKTAPMIAVYSSALLCSGIFCNMYERILYGYVRDYIKLNFIDFPVFNISDIFINVSVFVIVVIIIRKNFTKNNEVNNR